MYPQPIGNVGLSRVDVRDIADGISRSLLEDGHSRRQYPLVVSEVVNGANAAQIWSEALGKKVVYGGDDLEAWAGQASRMMPDWLVEDLKIMYEFFQKKGLRASEEELEKQAEILRKEPRPYARFVREVAGVKD